MSAVAARIAARVAAPVRAAPVRRFTTTRAPQGGDGHNHAMFDPNSFNPLGAPLVGFCFTLGGGLFVTKTSFTQHQRRFRGE
ncbi:hypothetical protein FNF27_00669 [Cafeteria roenbergensis]|uniref:Uncharacterized protein n=1 Tax=Cafeteria roenbergensis TaxID=33653 RepID=A0A5A8CYV1_CAFRO|nr:hypothetical protein FNF29_00022 [Cafeteria roenbergensis]KAA0158373.1 hypothetical protein FNF31_05443 [Cafeteria roenbergensis]KAA0166167.1 hypothetical protein FNF28_03215 [Cafeteria roenbergensis]KAA0178121.1 hypothetical protein FNF27_00669 [Cafeteria roenbergensis]|eukprot:KAA0157446.1 hypothetical protein FNF29_00022 [Cafeteria roenbergensis]